MATKSYSIANFSQVSNWIVYEYPQYNFYYSQSPTTDTDEFSIILNDIPAGSVINSAYIEAAFGSPNTGIASAQIAFKLGSGAYSTASAWDDTVNPRTEPIPVAYLAPGGTTSIRFSFRANGSLASAGSFSGSLAYASITVYVDYTPPTSASVSNVKLDNSASNIFKGAGSNAILSWTGTNGTNNAITSYSVYLRDYGSAWSLYASGITAQQYVVSAHATAGSNREFYVIAFAPYGNSADAFSPVLYSYSAVSVPGSVAISPASGFPNDPITLSWVGSTGGVGTTVIGYQILENGVAKATVSASPYVFSAPAAGNYTYTVVAMASVTGYNSAPSTGKALAVAEPLSSFTLNTPTVAMDGTSTIIATISPSNPAYNHDVKFELDATRTSTANVAAGGTSRSFVIPLTWCAGVPNATSAMARCTVTTKNGSTVIGSTYRDFMVTVPASVIPTVSLSVAPVNGFNGIYLKGKSSCQMTAAGAGIQGSTITGRSLYGGGHSGSVSPFTTGLLNTVGVNVMTAVVTDSRNRQSNPSTQNITLVDYAPPVISAVTAFRSNSGGTAQVDGTYIAVKASLVVSAVSGNSGTATVRKRATGGAWGSAVAIAHNTTVILSGAAIANAYEVEITLTDTVGTVSTYSITVNPAQFMFDFRMDRAGIGQLASGTAKTLSVPPDWTTNINAEKLGGSLPSAFALASHGNHVPTPAAANNAIFLRNDNSWQMVTPANIGAAAASHGNHVPTPAAANNAIFLRNDNSWQTVTPANIGALASTGKAADSSKLNNAVDAEASTVSTIAKRTTSGDIVARLFRAEYADQATISGAIAFRVNNTTDNYTRFCSDVAAIRTFLSAQKNITSGTAAPSGGSSGDIYIQYA